MGNMYDWEQDFPQVTKGFHGKICSTLEGLPEAKTVRIQRKRYLVLVAAALMVVSSITVLAAVRWNQRAIDRFGADEQMQEKLSNQGYSAQDIQVVSDNGITIKLEQSIQDDNLIYLLFRVSADNMEITEDNGMGLTLNFSGKGDAYQSISNSFVEKSVSGNDREYEIWVQKAPDYNYQGATLTCKFDSLKEYQGKAGASKDVVKGEWDFTIDLSANASTEYALDKTIAVEGCDVGISRVQLSPISYTLYCKGSDVELLGDKLGIHFEQLDSFYPLQITGVDYTDGTEIKEEIGIMSEKFDKTAGEYIAVGRFTKTIDMEKVQAILLGERKIEVPVH